jgi:methylase of polypeptide subunit release factors
VNTQLIARLAADLRAANFTVDALTELWGEDAAAALHRAQRVPALRALAEGTSALGTIARVFVLGLPSPDLASALPTLGLDGAVELGLVTPEGAPLLDLRPYSVVDHAGVASWWIASDLGELALGHAIPEHHVLGVGGASTTLSGLMMPAGVDLALDLGTGCGIQALHAARHAKRVLATDISERALELARFNAELNGVTTIEFRLGSLFEPVAGERFGHVVSNPPFVITPRGGDIPAYEYRDGGMVGDGIVRAVIQGVEAHLEPGGVAQLLGNWEYGAEDGLERVRGWIDETNLDAWVVERERQDVEQYAETWIRDGGTRPGPEFDRLYAAWLDDFAQRGVTEVGFGYVTLRKPLDGVATLRRFEHYGEPLGGSLGDHIAAVLVAHDWLTARDDTALAHAALTVAPDVTEERHYWPGAEDPTVMLLRQGSGFARTVQLGTALAAVVGASDGELSVGAICSAVADILEVDSDALAAEVLPEIRELVLTGFLLP